MIIFDRGYADCGQTERRETPFDLAANLRRAGRGAALPELFLTGHNIGDAIGTIAPEP
jgi:hypothetical protein